MDHPGVEVRETSINGRGVFAKTHIGANEVIAEFDGTICDEDYPGWDDDFENHLVQFEPGRWRDSNGIARLLNHSCEPNCGIKDLFRIVAMRDIEPGEELFWDYDMSEDNCKYGWEMQCSCGTASCRKIIRGYRYLPAEIRRKYADYTSAWLLQLYPGPGRDL